MSEEKERIVAAAIQWDGLTFSLPRPARHAHVLWATEGLLDETELPYVAQGFLTSEGRFVNRIEAKNIAFLAGQKVLRDDEHPTQAFSEDFW